MIKYSKKILELDFTPLHILAHIMAGKSFGAINDYEKGKYHLNEAIRLSKEKYAASPRHIHWAYQEMSNLYLLAKQLDKAMVYADSSLLFNNKSASVDTPSRPHHYSDLLKYNHYGNSLWAKGKIYAQSTPCLLYTSPSPRDRTRSRMPSSA